MYKENRPIQALEEIKEMMDRSSRFVSLSGWSGIAAGILALAAAWITDKKFGEYGISETGEVTGSSYTMNSDSWQLVREVLVIGGITFLAAFFFAFLFTYLRSRKTRVPIWGFVARRVVFNIAVPMLVGGLVIWRIVEFGLFGLVAPICLIFYGLALVNASKFTLSEVRYLGYLEILLGVINLWFISYGLYFWAAGFGVLHILYGIVMWNKYERNVKAINQ